MGEPMIAEVLDHRGRVRFRTRLDPSRPETIVGRALQSEILIDDPYLDARHLRIGFDETGGWHFADLGSVNGVWLVSSGTRQAAGPIRPGLELKAGRSTIRFVSPDAPVPPARFDPAQRPGIARRLLDLRVVVAILAVAVGFSTLTQYYGSTRTVTIVDLVTPGVAVLIFTGLWAAGWAFTNRLVAQRFRFLAHLAWATLIATVATALGVGGEWVGFFFPSIEWAGFSVAMWWFIGALLLAGHFELMTEWPRLKRWAVASATTGLLAVVAVLMSRSESFGSGDSPKDAGALKPVDVRYLPASSLDAFVRDADDLKQEVDETEAESGADSTVRRSRSDSSTASARHPRTSRRGLE